MVKKRLISIISPCYNEEKNVAKMAKEVARAMEKAKNINYEYIFVDDGSADETWREITKMSRRDRRVRGLRFTRNFGQQIALSAGIDLAKGDAVIYLDSDLQHPPSVLPELIKEWQKGVAVVHTKRIETEDIGFFKNMMSNFFYFLANILSDTHIERGMSDFKLLDKRVYLKLISMEERNRFLRGMVPWMGYPSATVEFKARKRISGEPWYGFGRNLEFAKNGILSLSTKPLRYIAYLGATLIFFPTIGLLASLVIILEKHDLRYISPTILLVLLNTLLIGFVISCLGVVALYISYLHKEVIKRPAYLIRGKVNVKK